MVTRSRPDLRRRSGAVLALAFAVTVHAAAATEAPPLILVELFTSQGCSSCPAADAVLARLADRGDVVALAFHVDYWDELGWKDTFSLGAATTRQRHYAATRHFNVYTPQMVIEGERDVVGSAALQAAEAIDAARLRAEHIPVVMLRSRSRLRLSISASPQHSSLPSDIQLIAFDAGDDVSIRAGENVGRTIHYRNVVRSVRSLGAWTGVAMTLDSQLTLEESSRPLAVVVQSSDGQVQALGMASPSSPEGP